MKVSSLAITAFASFAAASELDKRYKTTVEVECHEKTVTVTAGAGGAPTAQQALAPTSTIYTEGDKVTSVDYRWEPSSTYLPSAGTYTNPYNPTETISCDSAKWTDVMVPWTDAHIYPTGNSGEADGVHASFQGTIVIKVEVVVYKLENHSPVSTKTEVPPTFTPPPPPPAAAPTGSQGQPPQGDGQGPVPAPVNGGKTHVVNLRAVPEGGRTIFRYEPDHVNAQVNDIIVFTFFAAAHSATQSTFDTPCSPLAGGFDSQLIPNAQNAEGDQFIRSFVVTKTDPQWFYCKQQNNNHCGNGMVFGINPGDKMEQFRQNAIKQNGALVSAPPASGSAAPTAVTTGAPAATSDVSSVVSSAVTSDVSSAASTVASSVATDAATATGAPGAAQTILVEGNGQDIPFQFFPPRVDDVPIGTRLAFNFKARNHTLTESTLAAPCDRKEGGFTTGFNQFNPDNVDNKFIVDLVVENDQPRYFYCAQGRALPTGHCKAGMVFSINAGEERFNQFVANAKAFVVPAAPPASAKFRRAMDWAFMH